MLCLVRVLVGERGFVCCGCGLLCLVWCVVLGVVVCYVVVVVCEVIVDGVGCVVWWCIV